VGSPSGKSKLKGRPLRGCPRSRWPPPVFHEPTSPTIHMPNAERTEPSPIQLNIPGNRPWFTSLLSWRPKKPLQQGNRVPHSLPETPDDPVTITNSPIIVPPPEAHKVHSSHFPSSTCEGGAVPDPSKTVMATVTATPWLLGVSHFTCLNYSI
jgi:hypothetical protein